MDNYLAVDQTSNVIVAVISWDGVAPYPPPPNTQLIKFNGPAGEGWLWDGLKAVNQQPQTPPQASMPITTQLAAELGTTPAKLTTALDAATATVVGP